MYTREPRVVFTRVSSPYWQVVLKDPVTGKRTRKSSDMLIAKVSEANAIKEVVKIQERLNCRKMGATLKEVISLYENTETNPRYHQAKIDGSHYGTEHASRVSTHAKWLNETLAVEAPKIINKPISEITRLDMKALKEIIVEKKGKCRQAQHILRTLKSFFSQAEEDGLVENSVARGLRDISYKVKIRPAMEASDIATLIAKRDVFTTDEEWAFFTILATTGMRQSEVLAMSSEQLFENTLTINRAIKSSDKDDIGDPKWGVPRVIPLSKITMRAINALTPSSNGRFFNRSRYWGGTTFRKIQYLAIISFPDDKAIWSQMTAHVLRHSMNTNLLVEGMNPVLVAEYLSWSHQTLIAVQQRYTHIYAKKLQNIADCIDKLYTPTLKVVKKKALLG